MICQYNLFKHVERSFKVNKLILGYAFFLTIPREHRNYASKYLAINTCWQTVQIFRFHKNNVLYVLHA